MKKAYALTVISTLLFQSVSANEYEPIGVSPSAIRELGSRTVSTSSLVRLTDDSHRVPLANLRTNNAGSVEPIDTLSIRSSLLHVKKENSIASDGSAAGFVQPISDRVRLTLDGQALTLRIIQEQEDFQRGVRHVSAQIEEDPSGYAKFTVHGNTGEVVGTIHTTSGDYRIVPHSSGQQLVYPLESSSFVKGAMRIPKSDVSSLERVHERANALAALQPLRARVEETARYVLLQGGDLGTLVNGSAQDVQRVLRSVASLTGLEKDAVIKITDVHGATSGLKAIRFEQLIHGIPLERRNEIRADARGKVTELTTSLLNPEEVPEPIVISQNEAKRLAIAAMVSERHGSLHDYQVRSAELKYHVVNGGMELVAKYRFVVDTKAGETYWVSIDAGNGNAQILEAALQIVGQQYRHTICSQNAPGNTPSPTPTQCPGTGTNPVLSETTNVIMGQIVYNCSYTGSNQTNPCNTPTYKTPNDVMASVNKAWEEASASNPSVCCTSVGGADDTVGVIAGSSTSAGAEYLPTTDTIREQSMYTTNPDATAHEMAHAHQNAYNPTLVNTGGFTRSVAEGLADAATSVWAEKTGYSGSGNAWIIGDGTSPIYSPRNLSTPAMWGELNASSNEHYQGRIIGNFFYRLRQSGAVSLDEWRLV